MRRRESCGSAKQGGTTGRRSGRGPGDCNGVQGDSPPVCFNEDFWGWQGTAGGERHTRIKIETDPLVAVGKKKRRANINEDRHS